MQRKGFQPPPDNTGDASSAQNSASRVGPPVNMANKLSKRTRKRRDSTIRFDTNSLRLAGTKNLEKVRAILQQDSESKVQRISVALCHLLSPLNSIIKSLDGELASAYDALNKMKTHCFNDQLNPLTADTPGEAQTRCEFLFQVTHATKTQYEFSPPLAQQYDFRQKKNIELFLATKISTKNARDNMLFGTDNKTILDLVSEPDHLVLQHLLDFRLPGHCNLPAHHKSAYESFVEQLLSQAMESKMIISNDFTLRSEWVMMAIMVTKEAVQILLDLKDIIDADWNYTVTIKPEVLSQEKATEINEVVHKVEEIKTHFDAWFTDNKRYQSMQRVYHWAGEQGQRKKRNLDELVIVLPGLNILMVSWETKIDELKKRFAQSSEPVNDLIILTNNAANNINAMLRLTQEILQDYDNGYIACQQFLYDDSTLETTRARRLSRSSNDSSTPSSKNQTPVPKFERGKSYASMLQVMSRTGSRGSDRQPYSGDASPGSGSSSGPLNPAFLSEILGSATPSGSPLMARKKKQSTPLSRTMFMPDNTPPSQGSSPTLNLPSFPAPPTQQMSPSAPRRNKGSNKGSHKRSKSVTRGSLYTINNDATQHGSSQASDDGKKNGFNL